MEHTKIFTGCDTLEKGSITEIMLCYHKTDWLIGGDEHTLSFYHFQPLGPSLHELFPELPWPSVTFSNISAEYFVTDIIDSCLS